MKIKKFLQKVQQVYEKITNYRSLFRLQCVTNIRVKFSSLNGRFEGGP
jgi:hypothetical protein